MVKSTRKKKVVKAPESSRNWLRYFLALILLGALIAVFNLRSHPADNSQEIEIVDRVKVPSVTISLQQASNPSSKEIASTPIDDETVATAKSLVNTYLQSQKTYDIDLSQRLDDYVIHATSGRQTTNQMMISVTYSVKPSVLTSSWAAGNGTLTSDGWMRNKYGCAVVDKVNGAYSQVAGIGTSCAFTQ